MNALPFSFNACRKKSGITYNGNTLVYVFQTPAEDYITTYSSLHFAEVGQRRSMEIEHGKSLL